MTGPVMKDFEKIEKKSQNLTILEKTSGEKMQMTWGVKIIN